MKYRRWIAAAVLITGVSLCGCNKNDSMPSGVQTDIEQRVLKVAQDADGYIYELRNETVYATGDVNIRSEATSQSEIVDVLKEGAAVTRVAYNYSWSKVLYEGKTCYVSTKYLTTEMPEKSE